MIMAKILYIGDPHLKVSRLEACIKFLKWVEELVLKHKPDMVVNLGDTFHDHAVLRSEIQGIFYTHSQSIACHTPYVYLLGNHDFFKPKDSTYHALQTFKNIPGFTVIDKITHDKENGITWVPYQTSSELFPTKTYPICVAHQTFMGADFGFYRPEDGIDPSTISAEIIISGHIHKRQSFDKVIYPGTPFAQGVDDINQSKGVMLFDSSTYEYEFIESPLPKWKGLKLSLNDMSVDEINSSIAAELNPSDQFVIEITGPKAEIVGYLSSKEFLTLKDGKSIRVKPEYTDKLKRENTKIKSITLSNIVDEYVDKVYSGSLDRSIIKTTAHEILNRIK